VEITLDSRSQAFVDSLVEAGRYASVADAINQGLRLLQARDRELQHLRAAVDDALVRGGEHDQAAVDAAVAAALKELRQEAA
jgi:putative addiction module CopG family antidote